MRLDIKILAIMILIWGVLNTSDGIIKGEFLNTAKGIIGISIALYIYLTADGLIIPYRR